jgi:hypothetical protein
MGRTEISLICEKILDFLNAFPYIHPEILLGVPSTV